MSRHTCNTQHEGRDAQVILGYDRPLGGFYMQVWVDGGGGPLYASLADMDLVGGHAPDLDVFVKKLEEMGIAVPQTMIDEVRRDAEHGAGNRVRQHG